MLGPIPYMPNQKVIRQVCSTERAWMELLPQMGNLIWDPFDVTTLLLRPLMYETSWSIKGHLRKFRANIVKCACYLWINVQNIS